LGFQVFNLITRADIVSVQSILSPCGILEGMSLWMWVSVSAATGGQVSSPEITNKPLQSPSRETLLGFWWLPQEHGSLVLGTKHLPFNIDMVPGRSELCLDTVRKPCSRGRLISELSTFHFANKVHVANMYLWRYGKAMGYGMYSEGMVGEALLGSD
jgi:hypothetical protein